MFKISAWIIKGKQYLICLYDWRKYLGDTLINPEIGAGYIKDWFIIQALISEGDFKVIDPEGLAYPANHHRVITPIN